MTGPDEGDRPEFGTFAGARGRERFLAGSYVVVPAREIGVMIRPLPSCDHRANERTPSNAPPN
jgi:hypothetical protein